MWGGDDWGSLGSKSYEDRDRTAMEKLKLLGDEMKSSSGSDHHGREVKIRVPRKELEKLVGVQGKGLSAEQLLSQLIDGGDRRHRDLGPDHQLEHDDQRPWRPVLQSIPEVD